MNIDWFALANIFIPLTVFLLMVCVGMELTTKDFKRVMVYPKAVITGVVGQIILMPAIAFAVAFTMTDNMVIQIGIILLAACPGGPLSNSFVYMARAKTELSISLTAVNGFLALFTTPFIASLGVRVFAGENADIELPVLKTALQIFILAILPVLTGMMIRNKFEAWTIRYESIARRLTIILLVSHILLVILLNLGRITENLAELLPISVLFTLITMATGYFAAKIMGLDRDTMLTIGIEVGLQNVVLAILIANVMLERPEFSLFCVTYGVCFIFVVFPWIYIHRNGGLVPAFIRNR